MILGVIPARGGSKAIPRKNIKPLLGKPLIVWSIEAAKKTLLIDHFIVSTEDAEIASISEAAGANVLVRPESLALDNATTVSVLQHVLKEIPADIVVLLQPTSPVRAENIIDSAIELFFTQKCDTLATGYVSKHFAWGTFDNGPRQNLEGYFHDDGNVYIFQSQVLKAGKWIGDRPCRMGIPHIYNLEIDTIADFWAIEGILRHVIDGDHKDWI